MITVDAEKLKEVERRLGQYPKKAPLAIMRALNRTAANVKTNASKKVREEYTAKAKDVNSTFTVRRASKSSLSAAVESSAGALGLDKFKVSPKEPRHNKPPKALKVQVKKSGGAKRIVGAFVASVNGNKVFKRQPGAKGKKGKGGNWTALPIERLFGPPVPQMLDNRSVRAFVEQEAAKTFDNRLDHEIKRIMEGN